MKANMFKTMLVAGLAVLLLSGCRQKQTSNYNPQEDDFDYLITVGFVQGGAESGWKTANTESIKSTLTEENGYELLMEDALEDQEKQIKALRDLVEKKVNYIVLSPVVETGWETVLKEIKEENIPVIVVNNPIETEDTELYDCWLGSDFSAEGRAAGEWLVKYLKEQKKEKEVINLVNIQGPIGTYEQMGRAEGFGRILLDNEKWKMLAQQTGEGSRETGKEVMQLFLKTHPDIDAVIVENDEMTFGAVEALREAGKTCVVISYGGGRKELEAMEAGDIDAVIECNPLYGPKIAEIIQKMDAGVSVEKEQHVDEEYFDSSMELSELLEERTY